MRIYIKGFKSIANGQYLGIGKKITFLVGPNSAGKSVLLHALQKLNGTSPAFKPDDDLVHHNTSGDKVATSQSLGIEWKNGEDLIQFRATMFDADHFTPESENINDIFSENLTYRSITETESLTIENKSWCISQIINNQDIVQELLDEKKNSRDQHSRLAPEESKNQLVSNPIKAAAWGQLFTTWNHIFINYTNQLEKTKIKIKKAFQWMRDLISIQKDPAAYKSQLALLNHGEDSEFIIWDTISLIHLIRNLKGKNLQHHLNQFSHHRAVINKLALEIDKKFSPEYPGRNFDVALVSADRTLPTKRDLEAHLDFKESTHNPYHELIKSIIAKEWGHNFDGKSYKEITINGIKFINHPKDIGQLAININRHLSDGLFLDNGYQINVKSTIRLSKNSINNAPLIEKLQKLQHSTNEVIELFEFDAKLYITDSFGRELDFDRIGSGIGYVFPVLIECLRTQNAGGIVFLQQPELHLHPALQASLCDILIESASDRIIIAETHSEHLMLRALKRIRQTFNGSLLNKELELHPDDVAINYFEPMPDGTTRVHEIRIAADGEFIDKWPNGFFPERDQELFDE